MYFVRDGSNIHIVSHLHEREFLNANQRIILNKKNELVTQFPHYPRKYF